MYLGFLTRFLNASTDKIIVWIFDTPCAFDFRLQAPIALTESHLRLGGFASDNGLFTQTEVARQIGINLSHLQALLLEDFVDPFCC